MAPKKASSVGNGALEGFKAVDVVPPATRRSWATKAIAQFLEGSEKIVACEYGQEKTAISKQMSLNKAAKSEPYAGKVKIHRRNSTIYIERV